MTIFADSAIYYFGELIGLQTHAFVHSKSNKQTKFVKWIAQFIHKLWPRSDLLVLLNTTSIEKSIFCAGYISSIK